MVFLFSSEFTFSKLVKIPIVKVDQRHDAETTHSLGNADDSHPKQCRWWCGGAGWLMLMSSWFSDIYIKS